MKKIAPPIRQHLLLIFTSVVAVLAGACAQANAAGALQTARISAEVSSSQLTQLPGSQLPLAQAKYESGRLAAATKLQGISIYFSRTQKQQADLDALLAAQQNPSSPQYHQWLSPEQYAARFGMADSDLAKVQTWLEQQGFAVDSISRGKDMIRFSGTVRQVEAAFATEMHNFTLPIRGTMEKHFAPSTALSVPAALGSVVLGVRGLDDFRPKPMLRLPANRSGQMGIRPAFTSGQTGNIFISPGDITTIYDVKPLTSAGIDGTGQTIAVMGQSAVVLGDIEAFQTAASLTVKDPTILLVPGSGDSTVFQGDESESDLDLEWSGAIAPGAQILFVYVGNSSNSSVFESAQYAVDNQLASIISFSYGVCEFDLGQAEATTLEVITSRAASQGQSFLAASGDEGSTACAVTGSTDTVAEQEALNVSYPASSPYVTGVGGTEFNEGSNTSTYWSSNGSNDVITSALSYIPEVVWNDDADGGGLSASGGGVSTLFTKPSWQKGVAGIPSDGKRDVPDISLDASNDHDPYLYCTSDTSAWNSGQVASCNSGFRDVSTGDLTAAGGTSFATPIFAGMVARINQKQNYTHGSGLLNPALYTLASNSATYASAFHDVTTGNNDCTAGSTYCASGDVGYAAGVGYDLTTGLGTVDLANLAGVFPASTSTLIGTTTTVTASNSAPAIGANVTYAIAVASSTGSTVPTGTVTLTLDDVAVGSKTLSDGTASYTTSFSTAGAHVLLVAYSGDATHDTSTGTATVTVTTTSSGMGSFSISATSITVAQGSTGTSTITVTPAGGYTGTVTFNLSTTSSNLANACFSVSNASVTGTANATATLTMDTSAADCLASGNVLKGTHHAIRLAGGDKPSQTQGKTAAAAIFAGLLFAGFLGRYSRKLRVLAGIMVLATMGFALVGCGGSGSSANSDPPKGTYTLTLTGSDSTSATIPTATTTLTLTID